MTLRAGAALLWTTDAARPALLSSVTVTIRSVQVRGGRVHRNRIFKPAVSRLGPFIPGGVIVWTEDDEFRAFSSGWRLKSFLRCKLNKRLARLGEFDFIPSTVRVTSV